MAKILKNAVMSEQIVYLNESLPSKPIVIAEIPTFIDTEVAQLEGDRQEEKERIEKSYLDGFNQGVSEGIDQAERQMTDQTEALTRLLKTLPASISANRLELCTEITDIVFSIAQAFFIHQQHNKESMTQLVMQTLQQLNEKQEIELFLHPTDIALLQQGQINLDLKRFQKVTISADEQLILGGCKIKSDHGTYDSSVERQIDQLKQVLIQMKGDSL